ncbi:hypothetical protein LJC61_01440 [Ruminococcaceae bacterium OttesenSCG-928-A16]|nr:hypothetical protein [Ruminococcaceae bacterium OttesenSCG-928-A16]
MEPKQKDSGFKRRTIALAVLLGIILVLFIARLVQFQLIQGAQYAAEANSQTSQSSVLAQSS